MKRFGTAPPAARYSPVEIKKRGSDVGMLTGAASGALAGAATGTPLGLPGQIVGGIIGGITGGMSGRKSGPDLDQARQALVAAGDLRQAAAARRMNNARGNKAKKS